MDYCKQNQHTCHCQNINYCGIGLSVLITVFLLNCLDENSTNELAAIFNSIGDLLVVGNACR